MGLMVTIHEQSIYKTVFDSAQSILKRG